MYGQTDVTNVATKPLTESTNEFKVKTQGKKFARIKSGQNEIDVARAVYVQELEDRVDRLTSSNKKLEQTISKQRDAVNALSRELKDLRSELKNKMDKF